MARRQIRVEVGWRIQPDRNFQNFVDRINRLANDPAVMVNLVKGVMRATVLAAYRKRFLRSTHLMTGMEKESAGKFVRKMARVDELMAVAKELNTATGSTRDNLRAKYERLMQQMEGGPSMVLDEGATHKKEMQMDEDGTTMGIEESASGAGGLSTGQFTPRMGAILNLLVLPEYMEQGVDAQGNPFIGIGKIADLDAIMTPSHANAATGGKSRHKIMWRQLEFGTGIYAKPQPRRGPTKFKTTRGTWWYGPSDVRIGRFAGLHLRGSHPANVLRQASGLPYESDAMMFRQAFYEALGKRLFSAR